jgi:transmembrane protein EpsG
MTAALALFNCVVHYRLVMKYVSPRYYWMAVFLYVFTPTLMLIQSSVMRQSVAIALFVFSLDYIYRKDAFRYFSCIALASLFHYSALLVLPMYFLGTFNWISRRAFAIVMLSTFLTILFFPNLVAPLAPRLLGNYFPKYQAYEEAGIVRSGLGFAYVLIVLGLLLYFERDQAKDAVHITRVAAIGCAVAPLTLLIDMFARVGLYFAAPTMVACLIVLGRIKDPIGRIALLTLLFGVAILQFVQFFYREAWTSEFATYHTILSAPQWY